MDNLLSTNNLSQLPMNKSSPSLTPKQKREGLTDDLPFEWYREENFCNSLAVRLKGGGGYTHRNVEIIILLTKILEELRKLSAPVPLKAGKRRKG